jgi:hypothetical protein
MKRIEREKATVSAMIRHYCKKQHAEKNLCLSCSELLSYAFIRLDKCQFGNEKPKCKACPVHCYSKEKKQKIKEVMTFAGPAMLFLHPVLAFYHLAIDLK